MNVADIIVVLAAVAALAGLGWFFFGPRKATAAELAGGVQRLEVTVRGGYSPEVIRVRQGVPVELVFDRQESGDCTSRVVFPDFRLSAALPGLRADHGAAGPRRGGRVRVRVRDEHDPRHADRRARRARRMGSPASGSACCQAVPAAGDQAHGRAWPAAGAASETRRMRRRPSGGRRSRTWPAG